MNRKRPLKLQAVGVTTAVTTPVTTAVTTAATKSGVAFIVLRLPKFARR